MKKYGVWVAVWLMGLCIMGCGEQAGSRIDNAAALEAAIAKAQPGDTIVMANGEWRDIEILFEAQGTADKPVTLTAETEGEVVITGESNLRIAGDHLVVAGLVFKDGYSPTGSVISFRKNRTKLANHSRVTRTVIDNFSKPDKFESDIWVTLFGKHNRFDYNHLVGKKNQGVTLAVRLDTEASRENHHVIEYNYFGPRQVLGSNGGETLRIGTSHYSLSNSFTQVKNNVFDRCNGEVEIVSVKSGGNLLENNLFLESAGTLTLRHGNGNKVIGNVFEGNGKPHTGGIRVINANHEISNNYLANLTGHRFGGGLVIMNGVPNSPINRYHPVENVVIENNTLVNVDHVQLGAGSDEERSQPPSSTQFANNLFVASEGRQIAFTLYDDMSGIAFANNGVVNVEPGFDIGKRKVALNTNGNQPARFLMVADDSLGSNAAAIGAQNVNPVSLDEVGVPWYPKGDTRAALDSGKEIAVQPGDLALERALEAARPGDMLVLSPGEYHVDRVLEIPHALSIRGPQAADLDSLAVTISFGRNALFEIQDGGSLALNHLLLDGAASDDTAGNSLIRTSRYGMLNNYKLILDSVWVRNLDVNHSYSLLKVSKSTLADEISIRASRIENVSGDLLRLDVETDDLGIFNVDYLNLADTSFESIQGQVIDVYRGGRDESTFGPHITLERNSFIDVGKGKRNKGQLALNLFGAQEVTLIKNQWSGSGALRIESIVGEPRYWISENRWGGQLPAIYYRGEPVAVAGVDGSESTAGVEQ